MSTSAKRHSKKLQSAQITQTTNQQTTQTNQNQGKKDPTNDQKDKEKKMDTEEVSQNIEDQPELLDHRPSLSLPDKSSEILEQILSTDTLKNKSEEWSSVSAPGPDVALPRPLAKGNYPSLRIDLPVKGASLDFKLDLREDIYQEVFYTKRHYNFVGKFSERDHFVVSVIDEPSKIKEGFTVHKALTTTKKGYNEFEVEVPNKDLSIPLVERMEMVLTNQQQQQPQQEQQAQGRNNMDFYAVFNNAQFANEFVKLEATHPQKRKEMKIGVMHCKKGQILPSDMFQNGIGEDKCGDQFWKFIELMGHKINLENWEGYRGDMGTQGETYYEKWREIDIIYHISPMLNAEGHRRLVGNDLCVIFFLEEGEDVYFIPTHLSNLGTMPQVHAVIQPVGQSYRVAFFSNINIKSFGPAVPDELLSPEDLKNLVLTKAYNGLLMTKYCPPISRLFFVPRGEFLESIIEKFPYESKRARKAREKEERKQLQEQGGEKLILKAIAAKIPIIKEKAEHYSPYLMISLLDQKEKTKSIKGTAYPLWNAELLFSLVGVNEVYDDLQIACYDHNHSEYLGEVKITLKEVREKAKQPAPNNLCWYNLQKINSTEATGSVYLKFTIEQADADKNTEKDKIGKDKLPPKGAKAFPADKDEKASRRLSM